MMYKTLRGYAIWTTANLVRSGVCVDVDDAMAIVAKRGLNFDSTTYAYNAMLYIQRLSPAAHARFVAAVRRLARDPEGGL